MVTEEELSQAINIVKECYWGDFCTIVKEGIVECANRDITNDYIDSEEMLTTDEYIHNVCENLMTYVDISADVDETYKQVEDFRKQNNL